MCNTRPMTWDELAEENTQQKKEIERLKKEREWLLEEYTSILISEFATPSFDGDHEKEKLRIENRMQQALREK